MTIAEEREVTAEEYLSRIRTTSTFLRLEAGGRTALEDSLRSAIDEVGGSYGFTEYATLVTARVRATS